CDNSESVPALSTKLHQDRPELPTRFSDKYPDVIETAAAIAALTRETAEGKPQGTSQPGSSAGVSPHVSRLKAALAEAEVDLTVLKGEAIHLRQSIASYQQRVEKIPNTEQELK